VRKTSRKDCKHKRTIKRKKGGFFMENLIPVDKPVLDNCNCDSNYKIAEREFYMNQKKPYSGTRIICTKCGANKFIKDYQNLKDQILKAVHDSTDIVDGRVSIMLLEHFLDGILTEKCQHKGRKTATGLVDYCEDCKKILFHP